MYGDRGGVVVLAVEDSVLRCVLVTVAFGVVVVSSDGEVFRSCFERGEVSLLFGRVFVKKKGVRRVRDSFRG